MLLSMNLINSTHTTNHTMVNEFENTNYASIDESNQD